MVLESRAGIGATQALDQLIASVEATIAPYDDDHARAAHRPGNGSARAAIRLASTSATA